MFETFSQLLRSYSNPQNMKRTKEETAMKIKKKTNKIWSRELAKSCHVMTSPPQTAPASSSGLGSESTRLLFLENRPFSRNSSPFAAEMLTLRLRRQQDLGCYRHIRGSLCVQIYLFWFWDWFRFLIRCIHQGSICRRERIYKCTLLIIMRICPKGL